MKRVWVLAIAALFLIAYTATLHAAAAKDASPGKKFIAKAAAGGMFEVEAGKMAAEKAASEDVKKFGQRMVDDHSKANDELMQIADKKGVKPPKQLDAKHKQHIDKLSRVSGVDFDREYMTIMVKDHKKDIAEYSKEAEKGKDPDLKAFASKTVPILKEHLKMAQDLEGKIGGRKEPAKK